MSLLLLLLLLLPSLVSSQTVRCNILDPACRARHRQHNAGSSRPTGGKNPKCQYGDIWLIPGKADTSCTRPGVSKLVEIGPDSVVIRPEVIRLPGCFTVEIKNLRLLDHSQAFTTSFFAKAEYQWWNIKEFNDLQCQNASTNGCGGYGNNCYYCDVCDSLTKLRKDSGSSQLGTLLDGWQCPQSPGYYSFRKEFCFNDWSALDEDGDCQFDFLQANTDLSQYKAALSSLQQIGFGTMVGKFKLAHNATGDVATRKTTKEREIETAVRSELEERRRTWDESNGPFDTFSRWYIRHRKDQWHRDNYLPWLLYENEVACIRTTFDVCDRQPTRVSASRDARYNGPRYSCNALVNT